MEGQNESRGVLDFSKLSGSTNFREWKVDIEMLLRERGLHGFVTGTEEQPGETASATERNDFKRRKDKAISTIYLALAPNIKPLIANETDPVVAWKLLQTNFEPSSKALVARLLSEFYGATMESEESMTIFIARLEDLVRRLKNADCSIDDCHLAYKMAFSIPDRYSGIVQQLYQWKDKDFTSETVKIALLAEDGRLQNIQCFSSVGSQNTGGAFNSNLASGENRGPIKCFNCGQLGHYARGCTQRSNRGSFNRGGNRGNRGRGRGSGGSSGQTTGSDDADTQANCSSSWIMEMHHVEKKNDEIEFVFDSGATHHFSHLREMFDNFREIDRMVKQGKGTIKACGIGNIELFIQGSDGNPVKVNMKNVYFVPEMSRNLISLGCIEDAGWSYYGKYGILSIYDPNDVLFLEVKKVNRLYVAKGSKVVGELQSNVMPIENKDSLSHWHKRCVHLDSSVIHRMINTGVVLGVDQVKNEIVKCYDCIQGKLKRGPFKRLTGIVSTKPLELLHTDLWCSPDASLGGSLYFVGIVDDYSRWLHVHPVKSKSEAMNAIQDFITRVERQLSSKVLSIRSDNGLEFCNKEMATYCNSLGIQHQVTNTYSPEMNGVAEKINGDSMDAVRTMLISARLKSQFWGEALKCYVHVKNRVPHSMDPKTTPYEKFLGKKSNVAHFRTFGCLAFIHVPSRYRNKLEPKSRPGLLVGYATYTKGYRVLDPVRNEVVELKHVKVDESVRGIEKLTPTNKYMVRFYEAPQLENDLQESEPEVKNEDPLPIAVKQYCPSNSTNIDSGGSTSVDKVVPIPQSKCDFLLNWNRMEVPRKKSSRVDVYYYAPDGTRCKCGKDVDRYCEKAGVEIERTLFDFKPTKVTDKIEQDAQSSSSESDHDCADAEELVMCFTEIPNTYEEMLGSDHRAEWEEAVAEELSTMEERKVWDIVERPENQKVISCRWVFAVKNHLDGTIQRFKARLVAHGFKQRFGIDYLTTFSPVVEFNLVKLFFVLLVILMGWKHEHWDVKCAYLYGPLSESIFMEIPSGYSNFDDKKFCLKLRKSIYGLKQSGRNWYNHFTETLRMIGFEEIKHCPCIFRLRDECIILLYVDDIAVFGKDQTVLERVFKLLSETYQVVNLGPITGFLGVQFENVNGEIFLHQKSYIVKLLEKFQIDLSVEVYTPMEIGFVFSNPGSKHSKIVTDIPYRELLGSLLYLANRTRADILYPVIYLAQFSSKPTMTHWNMLIRILKYVGFTKDYTINLSNAKSFDFVMFSDASHASAVDSRRSVSGYIWSIGGVYLGWRSCVQKSIAKSAMEAEYIALDLAASEAVWFANILHECKGLVFENLKPLVFCDNQSAIAFSENEIVNNRTKHIDIRYHVIRNLVKKEMIVLKYVPTNLNTADLLTKPLLRIKLLSFVKGIYYGG